MIYTDAELAEWISAEQAKLHAETEYEKYMKWHVWW